jgi:4-carboxymuconolactone decarboxylase
MKPLKPDNWSDVLDAIRSFLGVPLNIHNMMAHHPDLLKVWMPFRNHVVGNSTLSARQRELLILRIAHNCQADYEWQHHVERGLTAGLHMIEIDRVKQGPDAIGWQADESALLFAVDDCHRSFCISDKNLQEIKRHFSVQQQLDITVTVGMYMTLALIIKTWGVPLEES